MRKNIVAGNWKMNTTLAEGLALAKGLDEALKGKTPNCDVIIGTPFTQALLPLSIQTRSVLPLRTALTRKKVLIQVRFLPLW